MSTAGAYEEASGRTSRCAGIVGSCPSRRRYGRGTVAALSRTPTRASACRRAASPPPTAPTVPTSASSRAATTRASATTTSPPSRSTPSRPLRSSTGSSRAGARRHAPRQRRGARARPHRRRHRRTTTCRSSSTRVTMALERHDLGIHLVVHPIVRVRRRRGGRARSGSHPTTASTLGGRRRRCSSRGCTSRSTARRATAALDAVQRRSRARARATSRAATSDWSKMLRRCTTSCAELERIRRPSTPASSPRAGRSCSGSATSTSRSSATATYDLVRRRHAAPGAGTGLGLAARRARDRVGELCRGFPPSPRQGARAHAARAHQGERPLHCAPPTYLDYVGVKRFDADGNVIGEHRFLGLYTSSAYTSSPIDMPVLRRKVAAVIDRAGFLPCEPRPEGPRPDPRDLPARRPLPDRRRHAVRDRDGDPAAAGTPAGALVRAP